MMLITSEILYKYKGLSSICAVLAAKSLSRKDFFGEFHVALLLYCTIKY